MCSIKSFFVSTILLATSNMLSATAQTIAELPFTLTCQDSHSKLSSAGTQENQQFCETRDLTMSLESSQPLVIDGGANGGITVHSWAGPDVHIRAKVQSWATTEVAAQAQIQRITIHSDQNVLRASAPPSDRTWAVSYEVFVPRQTALALTTINGNIALANVESRITFRAVNGGVTLAGLGGHVSGTTVNGGLNIWLSGQQWEGIGLDVATTNGGITWQIPPTYSAQLVTSTSAGGLRSELPATSTNHQHQAVNTQLGKGGATVKAVTTNGGIVVARQHPSHN
jgi:hypothetical protein